MTNADLNETLLTTVLALREQREELLQALRLITRAARSWHEFHHGSDSIQCDEICAALPLAETALELVDSVKLERVQ